MARRALLLILTLGCSGPSVPVREPSAELPVAEPVDAAPPAPEPEVAVPSGFAWEPLVGDRFAAAMAERWGIDVEVDDAAQGRYESPYDRYVVTTPYCAEYCVTITRVRASAPSVGTARARWDDESTSTGSEPAVTLDSGTTGEGLQYYVRRFAVRRGFPGLEGQTVHHLATVVRFFSLLPLDPSSHLTCTGYVEHAVERPDDPALLAARAVCASLRRSTSP